MINLVEFVLSASYLFCISPAHFLSVREFIKHKEHVALVVLAYVMIVEQYRYSDNHGIKF